MWSWRARGISFDHALEGGTVYAAKAVADRASEPMISYSRGAVASNIRRNVQVPPGGPRGPGVRGSGEIGAPAPGAEGLPLRQEED
jgi:hypothetical protein